MPPRFSSILKEVQNWFWENGGRGSVDRTLCMIKELRCKHNKGLFIWRRVARQGEYLGHGCQSWGGGIGGGGFRVEGRISIYPPLFDMFNDILFLGYLKT